MAGSRGWSVASMLVVVNVACHQDGNAEATRVRPDQVDASDAGSTAGDDGPKATEDAAAVSAPPTSTSPAEAAARRATVAAFLANPKSQLTPAIEEALLLEFEGLDPSPQAPGVQPPDTNWQAAKKHPRAAGMDDDQARWQALAAKHLRDPSAGVRHECVDLWDWWAADDAGKAAFVAAAANEPSPPVLARMITRLVRVEDVTEVRALLLKSADDASDLVRKAAVTALLDPKAKAMSGAFDKASDKLTSDPSEDVRYAACVHLYGTGDARAILLFARYLNDPATPDWLARGCWVGLQSAWLPLVTDYPPPNADAFRLTVAELEKTPRGPAVPPSSLGLETDLPAVAKADELSYMPGWRAATKDFLDRPRLMKALEAVVLDSAADDDPRTGAARDLRYLGESKASLLALERTLEKRGARDAGSPDRSIVRTLADLVH